MSTANLTRLSGMAAMLGGALFAAAWLLAFASGDPGSAENSVSRWVGLAAFTFLLLGLVGLYSAQNEEAGVVGFIGFLLAFVGAAVIIGYVIGGQENAIPEPTLGPVAGLSFTLGFVLLGLGSWMGGVTPRWAALLWAVGAAVWLIGVAMIPPGLLTLIGAFVFGAGLIGAGNRLVSR
jgi:hypothetical protein